MLQYTMFAWISELLYLKNDCQLFFKHDSWWVFSEETVRILQRNGGGAPGVSPALGIVLLAVFVSIAILLTGVIVVAIFVTDPDDPSFSSSGASSLSEMLTDSSQVVALQSIV